MTVKKVVFVLGVMAMTAGFQQLVMRGFGPISWPYFLFILGGSLLGCSWDAYVDRDEDG